MFKRKVLGGFTIVFNRQSKLVVFLVNLCNSLLNLSHVWDSIVLHVQWNRHFEQFYAFWFKLTVTSWVCFFLEVGCFNVKLSRLTTLANSVTLYTFKVSVDCIVPSFGEFEVCGGLFETFQCFFSSLLFSRCQITKETAWV